MTKRIKWPEFDEYEYYDNETSYLGYLCDMADAETGFTEIAKTLNSEFNNNRSASACQRQATKEGFV